MSNRVAVSLAVILCTVIGIDLAFGWGGTVFTLQKLAELIEWMAFWR